MDYQAVHNYSHLHHPYAAVAGAGAGAGVSIDSGGGDRLPQWSIQETQDFLIIRAELDPTFMETKRNKLLWELVSTRMKEKGYNRSPGQCKCKWKNLVSRYKGCETMEAEEMKQQFPFYNEMQAIFTERMQRILWLEAEGGGGATSSKKKAVLPSSSEEEDEINDEVESEGDKKGGLKKKRKMKMKMKGGSGINAAGGEKWMVKGIRGIMEELMKQQMEMEMQWMKAYEEREAERRAKEMEWRERMEALENERRMMERRWREIEEQRKVREEARAEKRDALITALYNKLTRQAM